VQKPPGSVLDYRNTIKAATSENNEPAPRTAFTAISISAILAATGGGSTPPHAPAHLRRSKRTGLDRRLDVLHNNAGGSTAHIKKLIAGNAALA